MVLHSNFISYFSDWNMGLKMPIAGNKKWHFGVSGNEYSWSSISVVYRSPAWAWG